MKRVGILLVRSSQSMTKPTNVSQKLVTNDPPVLSQSMDHYDGYPCHNVITLCFPCFVSSSFLVVKKVFGVQLIMIFLDSSPLTSETEMRFIGNSANDQQRHK